MAYFSLHAYDADVWVREFRGLNQAEESLNADPMYAAEAENMETPNGVLQPQAAPLQYDGSFQRRVETIASFTRRWYSGAGKNEWYVLCEGGHLYQHQAGSTADWDEISLPSGITAYQSSVWSCVTYEITENNQTIDVMLMSNGKDGMIMIIPPDRATTHEDLHEHTYGWMKSYTHKELHSPKWTIRTVNTQGKKFNVIERHMERIWGGAITDNPDMLMYSRPYDPTDWTAAGQDEEPEDGAGDVLQPSWDGDSFHALRRFGNQLLALKKNKIWKIQNAHPGEYVFSEQYGEGTSYFNTLAVDKERMFMMTADGLAVYDGMTTSPYGRQQVEKIWRTVNRAALDQMCAALFRDRYYIAFPVNGSAVNNAMLVYNMTEGTILYYKDFYVESFMPTDDELFMTSSTLPGKVFILRYDSWETGAASGAATRWVSPWMDFGYKRIQKGGFDVYFIPEVQDTAVELKFSVQTEKKLKTKRYTVQPLTAEQRARPKEHRGKRLHFGGMGRKFRVIVETEAGVTAPWRLIGGLQLVVETDPD